MRRAAALILEPDASRVRHRRRPKKEGGKEGGESGLSLKSDAAIAPTYSPEFTLVAI